jgi:hypothetical protein
MAPWSAWDFCFSDPIYDVGGSSVQVQVELAPSHMAERVDVTEPVRVHLWAPIRPEVRSLFGAFPEAAFVHQHDRDTARVQVIVPELPDLQAVRVTVWKDGELKARVVTTRREADIEFAWDGPWPSDDSGVH